MSKTVQYASVFEQSKDGFGAYVPDLPGCVAVGDSITEVETLIQEAIDFHLDGLKEDGLAIPPPSARISYVEARVA